MNLTKLKSAISQNVFVVSQRFGSKTSDYGKLVEVNEGYNIIIAQKPFGDSIIPIESENDSILKVYDKHGDVIYSKATKKK